jgi:hypothetical protein
VRGALPNVFVINASRELIRFPRKFGRVNGNAPVNKVVEYNKNGIKWQIFKEKKNFSWQ